MCLAFDPEITSLGINPKEITEDMHKGIFIKLIIVSMLNLKIGNNLNLQQSKQSKYIGY